MERTPSDQTVLVIDDEEPILDLVQEFLAMHGIRSLAARGPIEALEILAREPVDVVLTDVNMQGMSGLELLDRLKEGNPDVLVVLMTAQPSVDSAVRSLKSRAYDYLIKPFDLSELLDVIQRALEKQTLRRENAALKDTVMLYQLSQAVAASVDERDVLAMVIDTVQAEIEADAVTLFVREDDGSVKLWRDPGEGDPVTAQLAACAVERRMDLLLPRDAETVPGVEGFVGSAVAVPLRTAEGVVGAITALRVGAGRPFTVGSLRTLAILAGNAASAMGNARFARQMVDSRSSLDEANAATIGALVSALDAREHETQVHSLRVTEYVLRLAAEVGLSAEQRVELRFGAMLHDIGKIGVADAILMKPGALTGPEWEQMRRHPMIGYQILRDIRFLEGSAKIVLYHQERWDGTGYPFGLKGEEIPLGARLFAIADTFDAMTSDRPYRTALTFEETVEEIRGHRGRQFDPRLVDAFLRVPREEWERIRRDTAGARFGWQLLAPATRPADPAPAVSSPTSRSGV